MVHRRGFTLIELLVVISIIAILMGLSMPALRAARDYAVKTTCSSNLRQLGMGIQMYHGQWNDVYPTARYMPEPFISSDDDPPLHRLLNTYLTGGDDPEPGDIYHCPGDPNLVYNLSGVSYMYQSELSGLKIDEFFPVRMFNITPAEIVVMRDFDGGVFDTRDGEVEVTPFHDLRNLLFADFHAGNF
jgi:prepilin-type N-terminal cleavage/methylation domain-containing protein